MYYDILQFQLKDNLKQSISRINLKYFRENNEIRMEKTGWCYPKTYVVGRSFNRSLVEKALCGESARGAKLLAESWVITRSPSKSSQTT